MMDYRVGKKGPFGRFTVMADPEPITPRGKRSQRDDVNPTNKLVLDEKFYPRQMSTRSTSVNARTLKGEQALRPRCLAAGRQRLDSNGNHRRLARYQGPRGAARSRKRRGSEIPDRGRGVQGCGTLNTADGLRLTRRFRRHRSRRNPRPKVGRTGRDTSEKPLEPSATGKPIRDSYRSEGGRKGTTHRVENSVRHLAGKPITPKQVEAMKQAPGQSYLLTVDQPSALSGIS